MLSASLIEKLQRLGERHEELNALLSDAGVVSDQERFRRLSQEHAELSDVVARYQDWLHMQQRIVEARELMQDPALADLAAEELRDSEAALQQIEKDVQTLMLPRDPDDRLNVFLEIRAGTGGDEAAIFAGDLFRMYSRYAANHGWQVEIISESQGEHGGYKEVISRVSGEGVYSRMKFESGAHRVQRVPATEAQGRIHTSACTVAILPEPEAVNETEIRSDDLRVDTYRSSGAGGQHVNKTESAIRITHIPSGIVVECQDERSQHKNRARAMALLQAKLTGMARSQQQQATAAERRLQVGSGDRSERIRTYNFPQGRVTDHRINLTLYRLPEIVEGDLDELLDQLAAEHQADLLAELAQAG